MEIHRYEKIWIGIAILLIVGFISTVAYGAIGAGVQMVNDDAGTIDPAKVSDRADNTEFDNPGLRKIGPNEYEVYVVARRFSFNPGNITVPAGSTVTFYVTSPDVVHGFEIAGTNVNSMVIPGQITEMTVEFDEPEVYGIVCHEYCGAGHHDMEGRLNVVPASQFEYNATGGTA